MCAVTFSLPNGKTGKEFMCGLAGELRFDHQPADLAAVEIAPVKDGLRWRVLPEPVAPVREIVLLVREADLVRVVPVKAGRARAVPVVVLPVRVAPVEADREAATSNSIRWSA